MRRSASVFNMARSSRVFDGKKYNAIFSCAAKATAKEFAAQVRKTGYLVRVVHDPVPNVVYPWVVFRRLK